DPDRLLVHPDRRIRQRRSVPYRGTRDTPPAVRPESPRDREQPSEYRRSAGGNSQVPGSAAVFAHRRADTYDGTLSVELEDRRGGIGQRRSVNWAGRVRAGRAATRPRLRHSEQRCRSAADVSGAGARLPAGSVYALGTSAGGQALRSGELPPDLN